MRGFRPVKLLKTHAGKLSDTDHTLFKAWVLSVFVVHGGSTLNVLHDVAEPPKVSIERHLLVDGQRMAQVSQDPLDQTLVVSAATPG